jgi:RNA-directed DNA polymerase
VERFVTLVAVILMEEGFAVQHRKTRIMRPSVRQHLAGLVTNQRFNVRRSDFDLLKAILTNWVRHRPENPEPRGPSSFPATSGGPDKPIESIHPEKGRRLRAIFEKIEWQ